MNKYIHRYLEKEIKKDLDRKMVFIGGPRQSGKTTLAKFICKNAGYSVKERYLNWDDAADRENIIKEQFPTGKGILILDEIHKYSRWRQVVKGLFDKRGDELDILVTGSARLDYYRRGGDSLQGRYHFYRLLPLTLGELPAAEKDDLTGLFRFGGFPEPLLMKSDKETRRWSREYRSRVIREDLADLENVMDLAIVEHLVMRLPDLVGSPLSINALRQDLQVSHQSVSRWVGMLENLYMIFRIYPFGAPKIRAVKKEAKHYHLDWTAISDAGARFENVIACHLLKWCFFKQDYDGLDVELRYFRDVDKREVDFVIIENKNPIHFIECKLSDKKIALPLKYLKKRFPQVAATQVIFEKDCDFVAQEGIRVCSANRFLKDYM
jgi:predicted AAA+ superfamily ATPase